MEKTSEHMAVRRAVQPFFTRIVFSLFKTAHPGGALKKAALLKKPQHFHFRAAIKQFAA